MKNREYIVSTYNSYEWIHTEQAYCKLQLMVKYHFKGYKVWRYPLWLVIFIKKHFNILINWDKNATFELRIKGSDQVAHWSAYDNFR